MVSVHAVREQTGVNAGAQLLFSTSFRLEAPPIFKAGSSCQTSLEASS